MKKKRYGVRTPRGTVEEDWMDSKASATNYATGYRKGLKSQGKPYKGKVKVFEIE